MKEIENILREQVGLPEGRLIPGVYTNGFVSFSIQHIRQGKVLLYANTDIPYLEISEDEALEIGEKALEELFLELLADFRLKE
jgi:hypothetical protein